MSRLAASVAALAALTACTTLPEAPAVTERFPGDYAKLAACAYQKAAAADLTGLRLTDLRGANAIVINKDTVAYTVTPLWEARFTADGPNATRVEIKAFPAVWGADFNARDILAYARACSV
jgi:hypothetical protein